MSWGLLLRKSGLTFRRGLAVVVCCSVLASMGAPLATAEVAPDPSQITPVESAPDVAFDGVSVGRHFGGMPLQLDQLNLPQQRFQGLSAVLDVDSLRVGSPGLTDLGAAAARIDRIVYLVDAFIQDPGSSTYMDALTFSGASSGLPSLRMQADWQRAFGDTPTVKLKIPFDLGDPAATGHWFKELVGLGIPALKDIGHFHASFQGGNGGVAEPPQMGSWP